MGQGVSSSCANRRSGCFPIIGAPRPHSKRAPGKLLDSATDVSEDSDGTHQKSARHNEWLKQTLTSAHPDVAARREAHKEWLTHMLQKTAARAAAKTHDAWLDKQRLCAERVQGTHPRLPRRSACRPYDQVRA